MLRHARFRPKAALLSVLCVTCWTESAVAQSPVCPQPQAREAVYAGCLAGGRYVVLPFLARLTIDQLMYGQSGPIHREVPDMVRAVASPDTIKRNPELTDYLDGLGSFVLHPFDTSTGSVRLDVEEQQRRFETTVTMSGTEYRVALELPARLEAGYWRTPAVLQAAFWKGHRASVVVRTLDGNAAISAEVECAEIHVNGIRLVTTGSVPDLLVGFDSCE